MWFESIEMRVVLYYNNQMVGRVYTHFELR